ncbi:transporter [Halorubrum sp. Atlit-26R]|nr:transporter [Halorubrum sp. Atlit-26R]
MRTSTIVVLIGVALFLLPIPGTFILGAFVVLAGLAARLFGL